MQVLQARFCIPEGPLPGGLIVLRLTPDLWQSPPIIGPDVLLRYWVRGLAWLHNARNASSRPSSPQTWWGTPAWPARTSIALWPDCAPSAVIWSILPSPSTMGAL